LKNIAKLIHELNQHDYEVIFPMHPHTQRKLKEFNFKINFVKKPIGYMDLLKNLFQCNLVITDSGGLQKEAYWMARPCITLRENTEWIETIQEKANFLYSPDRKISIREIEKICKIRVKPKKGLFGNGKASEKISSIISKI
jgi:UDP-N-acetylglucosamine 2-epimerase